MFMNLAAFKTSINQQLMFQYQQIVGADSNNHRWIEMLYRPQNMRGNINVEQYFRSLSTQQKIELDIKIFDYVPTVQKEINPDRLSVNLMPITLLSPTFRKQLNHLIDSQQIDVSKLCVEIVETHSMPPLCSGALELFAKIRRLGGWVALDDFGSGYAHWELLQMGLIDVIKVANQNLSITGTSAFTHGLSQFASSMNIKSVLEGVETQADYQAGKAQGFQNFQGWYFGSPGSNV